MKNPPEQFNKNSVYSLRKHIHKLEEEKNYLLEIISLIPGHVYWKNRKCELEGCNNEQAYDAGLKSSEEIIGLRAIDLIRKGQPENERIKQAKAIEEVDEKVMSMDKTLAVEETAILDNGKTGHFLSQKAPLHDRSGKVKGLVGVTLDITKLKETEKELIDAKEKAEIANRTKTAFILDIQHDLRTPLTGLLGGARLLADDANNQLDQDTKKYLINAMVESSERLLEFINETLKALEIIQGGLVRGERKFNLKKLIEDVVILQSPVEKIQDLKFFTNFDEKVPQTIICDYFLLRRILLSLVSNAVKFTKQGTITIFVKNIPIKGKEFDNRNSGLRFEIVDTGIGISEEKQQGLFEMFSKVHPSNTQTYKGVGVGLFLVREAIELMDGDIELVSELDKGTTVRFDISVRLPLNDDCLDQKK